MHPKVATSLNYLAWDLDELGKSDEALNINKHALEIRAHCLGPDSIFLATSCTYIAWSLYSLG